MIVPLQSDNAMQIVLDKVFLSYLILTWSICSFLKGDMFIVHNELEDGWMWVSNVRTEEQGLIVEDLVEEVVSTAWHWEAHITLFFKRSLSNNKSQFGGKKNKQN